MKPNHRMMIAVLALGMVVLAGLILLAPDSIETRVRWLVSAPVTLAICIAGRCLWRARLPVTGTSVEFAFSTARATVVALYGIGTIVLAGCAWNGLGFLWLSLLELTFLAAAFGIDAILERSSQHGQHTEVEQLAECPKDARTDHH